jgi:HEPN domain-containing protein
MNGKPQYSTLSRCPVLLDHHKYVEASEILLDYNRVQPAVVLAALATEIFIKSFLATQQYSGHATTERGHSIAALFELITPELQEELRTNSAELDAQLDLLAEIRRHDQLFMSARYWYEPAASKVLTSETIHFARHLCEVVFLLGRKRGS